MEFPIDKQRKLGEEIAALVHECVLAGCDRKSFICEASWDAESASNVGLAQRLTVTNQGKTVSLLIPPILLSKFKKFAKDLFFSMKECGSPWKEFELHVEKSGNVKMNFKYFDT